MCKLQNYFNYLLSSTRIVFSLILSVLGRRALESDIYDVVMNLTELAKALLELEKFSLIKWSRSTKTLSIHRLIQTVIKDEMSENRTHSISKYSCGAMLSIHILLKLPMK